MSLECGDLLLGGGVPCNDGLVLTPREERLGVWVKGEGEDSISVSLLQYPHKLPAFQGYHQLQPHTTCFLP